MFGKTTAPFILDRAALMTEEGKNCQNEILEIRKALKTFPSWGELTKVSINLKTAQKNLDVKIDEKTGAAFKKAEKAQKKVNANASIMSLIEKIEAALKNVLALAIKKQSFKEQADNRAELIKRGNVKQKIDSFLPDDNIRAMVSDLEKAYKKIIAKAGPAIFFSLNYTDDAAVAISDYQSMQNLISQKITLESRHISDTFAKLLAKREKLVKLYEPFVAYLSTKEKFEQTAAPSPSHPKI